jgi:hypothetical protein
LPTEIARTTNYYRSNHAGNAPRRVILAGGGANLPYAKEFFEEKLGLPCEYFNPMRKVMVGKSVDLELIQKEAHMMGELVGLGLRSVGKSSLHIDLVPSSVEEERAAEKRRPFLIAAAALLIAGFGAYAFWNLSAASTAEAKLEEITSLQSELAATAGPIKSLLAEEAKISADVKEYVAIKRVQESWPTMLDGLREHFSSEFTWIVDLEPLANFDPTKKNDAKVKNGDSLVKPEFDVTYGSSQLASVKVDAPATPGLVVRPRPGQPMAPAAPAAAPINAIRIKGLWRENPIKQDIVKKMVDALIASGNPYFNFTTKDAKGQVVPLQYEQIVRMNQAASDAEEEYAWPFEVVIPLAQPLPSR